MSIGSLFVRHNQMNKINESVSGIPGQGKVGSEYGETNDGYYQRLGCLGRTSKRRKGGELDIVG